MFLAFLIYVGSFENVSVYNKNNSHFYTQVTNYTVEYVEDDTAPEGIHTVYRWNLQTPQNSENCLCFYVSHHYVQVTIDNDLVYSLGSLTSNRISYTVGNNWVTLPVHPEDGGKEIAIVLTPLYDDVTDSTVEFLLGSHSSIVLDVMDDELPLLLVASLAILLGFFIILVQLYFHLRINARTPDLFFLGCFSICLGTWKIADLRCAPFFFTHNPMVLSYIAYSSLYLCSILLLLFLVTHFTKNSKVHLYRLSIVYSLICCAILLLQLLGIIDLRDSLTVSHLMLICDIAILPATVLLKKIGIPIEGINRSWKPFLILASGIALDIVLYQFTGNTSIFTICAFLIYAVVVFMTNILNTTKKAYLDSATGLSNKSRWLELIHDTTVVPESEAIVIMDLNGLKNINDTYGHEAGDQIIFQFSNILRNTFPSNSVLCRWGGDEFTVLTTGLSQAQLDSKLATATEATLKYNKLTDGPHIHFAYGYALSEEYPGLTRKELMSVADSRMYLNKKQWYAQQEAGVL